MTSRRTFLVSAAGAMALPPFLRARVEGLRTAGRERPYLDLALECARWIEASRQSTAAGAAWPADPLKPESVGLDLYNGMPGVVLFYLELYHATGEVQWLRTASTGADHLIAAMAEQGETMDPGFYTGLAGFAFTFDQLAQAGNADRYHAAAERTLDLLVERVTRSGKGIAWNDVNDIISGSSGIGLTLLALRPKDGRFTALAADAGRALVERGMPAEGGLTWLMTPSFQRNMPNFSHGTAGVAYFLATLHQRTGDRSFLDAALAGAGYLDAIATRRDGATVIRHHDGDGRDLFYLSWCHGPVGTARLFYRLHRITGDQVWMGWVESLTRGILASGVPEQRTPGFWNNISQCCGDAGVGQYFLDLQESLGDRAGRERIERVLSDITERATRDERGLRWVQAEHRVQPENRVAQTGFMQGAAGVGTLYLRLDAVERGMRWRVHFPDTPWERTP
ncbi:MAG TPA: lanthionine synthetase LanC family protein [Gemmatimonadales bacterium]